MRTIAAFDVDGTLTTRDTLTPFLVRAVGWPRLIQATIAEGLGVARIAIGRGDRDATKERILVRLLADKPYAELLEVGERYAQVVATGIRPVMRERIEWHRAQGHDVVLVSASLDVYLAETGKALGCDAVLCTSLAVDDNGTCSGRFADGNCRGPGKVRRLAAYIGTDDATVWAYGDSAGDDEMLAYADHAIRVVRRRGRVVLTMA